MTLLEECIESLGYKGIMLNECDSKILLKFLMNNVAFLTWGRIDWSTIKTKNEINSVKDLDLHLKYESSQVDNDVFIIWDNAMLPVIKSDIKTIVSVLDDVLAVSFDTWLFCPKSKYIVEFTHDGIVTLGVLE